MDLSWMSVWKCFAVMDTVNSDAVLQSSVLEFPLYIVCCTCVALILITTFEKRYLCLFCWGIKCYVGLFSVSFVGFWMLYMCLFSLMIGCCAESTRRATRTGLRWSMTGKIQWKRWSEGFLRRSTWGTWVGGIIIIIIIITIFQRCRQATAVHCWKMTRTCWKGWW